MNTLRQNRAAGFIYITAVYIIATVIGIAVYFALPDMHLFWQIMIADIAATIVVFLAGVVVKNTSVYDPYWSVAPIVILTGLTIEFGRFDFGIFLLLFAVWYWGVRLTLNWAYTFKNLAHQDWRYDFFKAKFPRIFQVISFFGINMFPTEVVFLCLLPGVVFLQYSSVNIVTAFGFAICVVAATLQLIADIQMQKFRNMNPERKVIIRDGLWKHSRHPNYLGEIMMWWGLCVMMLSVAPDQWILGAGALVNTLMFLIVSIPLADKRNQREREGFDEYKRQTNMLLPFSLKKIPEYQVES